MAVNDPYSARASLNGQLKIIEERLNELSAAPLGKVKWGLTPVNPLHPTITTAPTSLIATIAVPALATQCGYSILTTGLATNPGTTAGLLTLKLAVTCGSYNRTAPVATITAPPGGPGTQMGLPMVDTFTIDPGATTITVTASINCDAGTWTDPNNTLTLSPMAIFAY